jgi:anti-sigma regulatory factor (Ser/Thr protein kinase)
LAIVEPGLARSSAGQAPGVPVTRLSLVSRPASAREARDWLTALLAVWGNAASRHNATLLLSEVVTNAVRHARGGTILVAVTLSPSHLLAQVHDDSSNLPVRRGAGETGGWGLGLLDELSTQWGVDQHSEDGKTVWFEIDGADLQHRPGLNT